MAETHATELDEMEAQGAALAGTRDAMLADAKAQREAMVEAHATELDEMEAQGVALAGTRDAMLADAEAHSEGLQAELAKLRQRLSGRAEGGEDGGADSAGGGDNSDLQCELRIAREALCELNQQVAELQQRGTPSHSVPHPPSAESSELFLRHADEVEDLRAECAQLRSVVFVFLCFCVCCFLCFCVFVFFVVVSKK